MGLVRLYQLVLSPWIGNQCRFQPTCSAYGLEALARFGAIKGSLLTLRRLGRCHPWGGSGYDPVPGTGPKDDAGAPPDPADRTKTGTEGQSVHG
ncbi:membrane protein insertion efficiency factor YidD [Yunchengibacter salinarum]|uniref:membrane protein insertion efficiency factor YidD n=1 Tax=Yunchengibacter salinarum TaxID=3133399 RepID=UPI0035B656E8